MTARRFLILRDVDDAAYVKVYTAEGTRLTTEPVETSVWDIARNNGTPYLVDSFGEVDRHGMVSSHRHLYCSEVVRPTSETLAWFRTRWTAANPFCLEKTI